MKLKQEVSEAFWKCFVPQAIRTLGTEKEYPWVDSAGNMVDVSKPFQTASLMGFEPDYDDINKGTIVGFKSQIYGEITMDAGSLELVTKPRKSLHDTVGLHEHLVDQAFGMFPEGNFMLAHGTQPLTPASWERWTPKGRYRAMRTSTNGAVKESCITASFQTHVSVGAEEMVPALNTVFKASGLLIAISANGNIRNNSVDRHKAWRENVWDDFGPDYRNRIGISWEPFRDFEHLMEFLFNLPTLFYKRKPGDWPTPMMPFKELVKNMSPEEAFRIWPYHLSTYWVVVRPREFGTLEIRPCCPQPNDETYASDALCVGLVENHRKIWQFLEEYSWQEMIGYRTEAIEHGLEAKLRGKPSITVIREFFDLVIEGLKNRNQDEQIFLQHTLKRINCEKPWNWADLARKVFEEGGIPKFIEEFKVHNRGVEHLQARPVTL